MAHQGFAHSDLPTRAMERTPPCYEPVLRFQVRVAGLRQHCDHLHEAASRAAADA